LGDLCNITGPVVHDRELPDEPDHRTTTEGLAIYGNNLRDWSRQAVVPVLENLVSVGEGSAAAERQRIVRRRIRESFHGRRPNTFAQFARATFSLAWSLVMLAQVLAEVLALNWLSTPHAGPDQTEAKIGALAIVIGTVWIALFPVARLHWAPYQPIWYWWLNRNMR
ncbi:hypothetical protein ABZY09_47415, partial [Streptomyces sp. NPDC002928]|uniref:hypothetical protein n=1 Tax=Streptomyces sp. NPDC002928 TaxID=3154440 RepID=UPI0033B10020